MLISTLMVVSFGAFYFDGTKCSYTEVPASFERLTDPAWRSKLILAYANDDVALGHLFSLIISRYGFQWFKDLAANDVM